MGIKVFEPAVSNHAVIRCVQHFMGVVLDLEEELFGTPFCMHLHLYAAGRTREEIAAAILTPAVRAPLMAGATRITINGGVIIADGRGLVVTVHPNDTPRFREKRRFQKGKSRAESKRQLRKIQTREKRRPVNAL